MKSYRKELYFETPTRRAFINITDQVEACLHQSGIKEGLCLVNTKQIDPHLVNSFVNEAYQTARPKSLFLNRS